MVSSLILFRYIFCYLYIRYFYIQISFYCCCNLLYSYWSALSRRSNNDDFLSISALQSDICFCWNYWYWSLILAYILWSCLRFSYILDCAAMTYLCSMLRLVLALSCSQKNYFSLRIQQFFSYSFLVSSSRCIFLIAQIYCFLLSRYCSISLLYIRRWSSICYSNSFLAYRCSSWERFYSGSKSLPFFCFQWWRRAQEYVWEGYEVDQFLDEVFLRLRVGFVLGKLVYISIGFSIYCYDYFPIDGLSLMLPVLWLLIRKPISSDLLSLQLSLGQPPILFRLAQLFFSVYWSLRRTSSNVIADFFVVSLCAVSSPPTCGLPMPKVCELFPSFLEDWERSRGVYFSLALSFRLGYRGAKEGMQAVSSRMRSKSEILGKVTVEIHCTIYQIIWLCIYVIMPQRALYQGLHGLRQSLLLCY